MEMGLIFEDVQGSFVWRLKIDVKSGAIVGAMPKFGVVDNYLDGALGKGRIPPGLIYKREVGKGKELAW